MRQRLLSIFAVPHVLYLLLFGKSPHDPETPPIGWDYDGFSG